jgi:hypothetical protein
MGDYSIDTSFRLRYLLDGYAPTNSGVGIQPVASGFAYSFSTREQAEQIRDIASRIQNEGQGVSVDIVRSDDSITGGVIYNYRDESDPTNLYAFAIVVNFTMKGQPAQQKVLVGNLIAERIREKSQSGNLGIDPIGQIKWV